LYSTHPEYQKENSKKHMTEYRQNLREYALEYLSTHPCSMCGETDPVVLDFHHTGDKVADVSVVIGTVLLSIL